MPLRSAPARLAALLLGALLPTAAAAGWSVSERAAPRYSEAVVAQARGQLEQALAAYEATLAQDPGCGSALHGKGMVLLRLGRLDEAEALARALSHDWPKKVEAHTLLSSARFVRQNPVGARAAAEEALRIAPDDIAAHAAMLQALLRLGDAAAARALAAQAVERLPAPVGACMQVAVLQELKEPVDADLGARCAAAGPELIGWMPLNADQSAEEELKRVQEALARINAGDPAGALLLLDPVVAARPQRGDARALRGIARLRVGNTAGGVEDLRAAVAAEDWLVVHRSGAVSGVVRASDAAKADELRAIASGHLVLALVQAGQLDDAAAVEGKALARFPQAELLRAARALRLAAQGQRAEALALVEALSTSADYDVQGVIVDVGLALGGLPDAALAGLRESAGPGLLRWASARDAAGDPAGCSAALGPPADLHPALLRLGWGCAVRQGDAARAGAWWAKGGPPLSAALPVTAYNHALLLRAAGDGEGAWAVLAPAVPGTPGAAAPPPEATGALHALAIALALDAGALDAALARARAPGAPAAAQAQVGARLLKAGRAAEAKGLLRGACPALQGAEAEACASNLARAGG